MTDIYLPVLHEGQREIWRNRTRLNAVRCGRRWGKTKMMVTIAADSGAKGEPVGLFTPEHKQLAEPFDELKDILSPIIRRASANEGVIKTWTGGVLDFWATGDNELAGRGREYRVVLMDEQAFTKNSNSKAIWERSIKPTMLTTKGTAWAFSTPNGMSEENLFWQFCNDPAMGFENFHAPTSSNPYVPQDELEQERIKTHPLVFQQEFLAEFVDWSGVQFFDIANCLAGGEPVDWPTDSDCVFAVIDSAIKTGRENDGTAVGFFARNNLHGHRLVLLDWDIVQIEGGSLEDWIPSIFERLEYLAQTCRARAGTIGTFIEDKASGSILLQQGYRRGWPVTAIDSGLTAMGKDERCIDVSGYVYQGLFKLSRYAYEKVVSYKGASRNHFNNQFFGYRVGVKNQADDLLDVGCYGIAIALGNSDGY